MEKIEIQESINTQNTIRIGLTWLVIYSIMQLVINGFNLCVANITLKSLSQQMDKTNTFYQYNQNNLYFQIISFILTILSIITIIMTLIYFYRNKGYKKGVLILMVLWTFSIAVSVVSFIVNNKFKIDNYSGNTVMMFIISFVQIIVYFLIYQAFTLVNEKTINRSFFGLVFIFILSQLSSYMRIDFIYKNHLVGLYEKFEYSFYMFNYIYSTIIHLLSWIIFYLIINRYLKYYKISSNKRNFYKKLLLSIIWFIICFILIIFIERILTNQQEFDKYVINKLFIIISAFLLLPFIWLMYLPLKMLKTYQANCVERIKTKVNPLMTLVILLVIPLLSWGTLYVKSHMIYEDAFTVRGLTKNINIRVHQEINEDKYILYTAEKVYNKGNTPSLYIVIAKEETSIFGFKKYTLVSNRFASQAMHTKKECDEECFGLLYGQNTSRYQEAIITFSNDQMITVNLEQNDWIIVRFEYDSELYIKKIEYR